MNHISICFHHNINVKENDFVFRARAEKGIAHCATHRREQRGMHASSVVWNLVNNGLVIFDWFVLSMRMQVILDSPFARSPGSAPIGGRKERRVQGLDYNHF